MGSNPIGKVRIVARIRGQINQDAERFDAVSNSNTWISVSRPDPESNPNLRSSRVKISFGSDQTSSGKQSYELDECYEQEVGNKEIFSREIKPLIIGLFKGQNSTVFAYGTRGSGKTYTIQGCEKDFGLAVLSVDAILPQVEEHGKNVTISVFEVHQDRVSDLLDTNKGEVSVLEDAQGKIRLKGLSKVKVNSALEFHNLYVQAANTRKQLLKTNEPPHRSHIGCIVHVVSPQTEKSSAQLVGKINFIDLASYEDSRRKSSNGFNLAEATRINKSLYAVHNVLYALNAKEARVPYRESKLTRMLQDSLGGRSKIVMVTCMVPSICQETVQTISLASRSCMAGFLACLDPGKSASKTLGMSSPQVPKSASKFNTMRSSIMSPKLAKPMSSSASGNKLVRSQLHMSMKKAKDVPSEAKGRKLFGDASHSKKSNMKTKCPESASVIESSAQRETSLSVPTEATINSSTRQEEKSAPGASSDLDSSQVPYEEVILPTVDVPATPIAYQTPPTENYLIDDKENKSCSVNAAQSPPLSARIRELSDNLKSLCFSTEANLKMAQDSSNLVEQVIHENLEPTTPTSQQNEGEDDKYVIHEKLDFRTPIVRAIEKYDNANLASPWENFHIRSTGIKDSLVNECLKFINSASKEELKGLKGIGEKRATYIIEMREESPEPFKELDDLKQIGLSGKQINGMMKKVAGGIFEGQV